VRLFLGIFDYMPAIYDIASKMKCNFPSPNRDGATGDEIVEALIANSSTFGKKTVFSQVSARI
jgi:hypothetical protein